MENHIHLSAYHNEKEVLLDLIQRFWIVHNDETPSPEEVLEDFHTCTRTAHISVCFTLEAVARKSIG